MIAAISVNAAYVIIESFPLVPDHTSPSGFASNATATDAGDFWILQTGEPSIVFHYSNTGTLLDNFTLNNTNSIATGIWINDTIPGRNSTPLFIQVGDDNRIYVTNLSGINVVNLTTTIDPTSYITSNATAARVGDIFAINKFGNQLIFLNGAGTTTNTCSIASFTSGNLGGIATNYTTTPAVDFWIGDAGNNEIYRIDNTCVRQETIDVGSLGITDISGITTRFRGGNGDDLYVVDAATKTIYLISQTSPATTATPGVSNISSVELLKEVNLSFGVTTVASSAFATLITNQTGIFDNITDGRYGSPFTLNGSANIILNASFIWIDEMFTYTGFNQTLGYQVMVNDSLGNVNISTVSTIKVNAFVITELSNVRSISSIVRNGFPNITITFNRTATQDFSLIMPSVFGNATFSGCNYEAFFAERIQSLNTSFRDAGEILEYCNITFFSARFNSSGVFTLVVSERFSFVSPRNLPVAIGGAAIITFIIVYLIRITRRK